MKKYTTVQMMRQGLPIHIFFEENAPSDSVHTHDFIEIIYVFSGNALQTVNGNTFTVTPGDLIFLNYGSTHAFVSGEKYSYYNICFAPELPADRLITPENALGLLSLTAFDEMRREAESGKVRFTGAERRRAEWILRSMLAEYETMQPLVSLSLEGYMNVLLTEILRKTLPAVQDEAQDVWKELFDYIEDNLSEPLTLSSLARQCFYNPSYFSRVFKEKYGVSLTKFVAAKRIECAKQMLCENAGLSVAQIAQTCGFPSANAFYRAFEKECGVTPAAYRAAAKGKKSAQNR